MRACVASATERCCGSGYDEIWPYMSSERSRAIIMSTSDLEMPSLRGSRSKNSSG